MYVHVSKYHGHLSNMAYISAKSEIENNTSQQKQILVHRLYIYLPTYLSFFLTFCHWLQAGSVCFVDIVS